MPTCPSCRTRYPANVESCEVDGERLLPDEAFSAVDRPLEPGTTVGEYRIEEQIGEGGFGVVYRAVHPVIGKPAAIKVLARQYSSNPDMVARFIDEARAVNQIRNRNIIDIFSFGILEDGRQFFVMELLEGLTLDRYLRQEGRLSPEVAIPVMRQIARALDAAHAAGIAHRDLKPENVFLQFDEDDHCFPKLLDFGIAKLLGDSARTGQKTRTGTPLGTPLYMSPEQCRGQNVDHRTDIYSFGIMCHEILTGKPPFDSDNMMDLMLKQTAAPAPPMSTVCAEVPPSLDAPVLHMLEKEADKRPQTVTEAIDALARAASGAGFPVPVQSRPGVRVPSSGQGAVRMGGGHMTPEQAALAEARTVAHVEASRTFQGSETLVDAPKARRRGPMMVGVGAFAVGTLAVVAYLGIGEGAKPTPEPTPATSKPAVTTATPVVTPVPAPTASPAGAASTVAPEVPAEVMVSFAVAPEVEAEVWHDGVLLGTTKSGVKLPRADEAVVLSIKRTGFLPAELSVVPDQDKREAVALRPTPSVPKPNAGASGELQFE